MTKPPAKLRSASTSPWNLADVSEAERLNHWVGDPSFMLSLARGMLVLHAIADGDGQSLSIAKIAAATGLSQPAVRRCLYTLDAIGYVKLDRSGGTPGPRLTALTAAYAKASPLISSSRPILDALRDAVQQTVVLGIREHSEAVYIAHSYSDAIFKIQVPIGARFPLYPTSIGRVFLAGMPDEEIEAYLASVKLAPLTEKTLTEKAEIRKAIEEVRRKGYAISEQEVEIGLRNVSAPVRDRRGDVVAAITIGTHMAITGPRELRSKILPALLASAQELSALLP